MIRITTHVPTTLIATLLASALHLASAAAAAPETLRGLVTSRVEAEYPSLLGIYTNLHAHPELSFMEVKTAALVAGEWRKLGFTVTEKVGQTGVVGVLTNGAGPTVLVRGDMDGLPVQGDFGRPVREHRRREGSVREGSAGHACLRARHSCHRPASAPRDCWWR